MVNAAIWLGAAVFVTLFAGPAFFSDEMLTALKYRFYAGEAAQIIISRYFILHYICGVLAVLHLVVEWLYLGRHLTRFTTGLLAFLVGLTLFGGVWMQPKMRQLHHTMYLGETQAEQDDATKTFRAWHGASQAANLFVTIGLLVYFWRLTHPRRMRDVSEL